MRRESPFSEFSRVHCYLFDEDGPWRLWKVDLIYQSGASIVLAQFPSTEKESSEALAFANHISECTGLPVTTASDCSHYRVKVATPENSPK